jgi:uncharacterized protein (TIRG00374 family)
MTSRTKHWIKFTIRWGIAVVGIVWVLWSITFRDRVTVINPSNGRPEYAQVLDDAREEQSQYRILRRNPDGTTREDTVSRDEVWGAPDRKSVDIQTEGGKTDHRKLLAVRRAGNRVAQVAVEDPSSKKGVIVEAQAVIDAKQISVGPRVEVGLIRMVKQANRGYLLGAIFIIPVCHLLTSMRWHVLLRALEIHISQARAFTINMVGAFYNAFMPGTTGGDLVKAYYAAKHAPDKRTRAVMSVLVDRAVGLYALVLIGGAMAAYQWDIPICRKVAKAAAGILAVTAVGCIVFYVPALRRLTGFNYIVKRLPMQATVGKAIDAMETYGRRPLSLVAAFMLAFPVHVTAILSATMAGNALGLKLNWEYYWAMVPVIALVGAIPISPQGAGVMEFVAVQLTRRQGITVSQAFALTMAIRIVQIIWNLAAGVFVLRGGYHAPTEKEAHELETDEPAPPEPGVPAAADGGAASAAAAQPTLRTAGLQPGT